MPHSKVIKTHEWTGEMSKASFDEVRSVPRQTTCIRTAYNPSKEIFSRPSGANRSFAE